MFSNELSIDIEVHNLRFVREYIGKNHEFVEYDSDMHQIEYMFACKILGDWDIKIGHEPDVGQIGYEWLPLTKLYRYRIYPSKLKEVITENGKLIGDVYLGDVN